jgi:hypothetical protein
MLRWGVCWGSSDGVWFESLGGEKGLGERKMGRGGRSLICCICFEKRPFGPAVGMLFVGFVSV